MACWRVKRKNKTVAQQLRSFGSHTFLNGSLMNKLRKTISRKNGVDESDVLSKQKAGDIAESWGIKNGLMTEFRVVNLLIRRTRGCKYTETLFFLPYLQFYPGALEIEIAVEETSSYRGILMAIEHFSHVTSDQARFANTWKWYRVCVILTNSSCIIALSIVTLSRKVISSFDGSSVY